MNKVIHSDCLDAFINIKSESIDLIYLDPPFFTQKKHILSERGGLKSYEFDDKFESLEEYLTMIRSAMLQSKRALKETGNLFLHCDKTSSHHLRVVLDEIFGQNNFRSEIIWSYKRWSNSKKGLMNSHQVILYYSKSDNFKFNTLYTDYSPTTNIDQILQDRERDNNGKSVYKKGESGEVILGKEKKGVPLSDVWEIPYLNPKAKERVGYPTQKPVLLLNQVIKIASDEGDLVLDPFCGSGTTCVSAKFLKRNFIGIDKSLEAVELARKRIESGIITESNLLKNGAHSYIEKSKEEQLILDELDAIAVQRNSGIDGFLREHYDGKPVPVKIQSKYDSLEDTIEKLERATKGYNYPLLIVVQTKHSNITRLFSLNTNVKVIKSLRLQLKNLQVRVSANELNLE